MTKDATLTNPQFADNTTGTDKTNTDKTNTLHLKDPFSCLSHFLFACVCLPMGIPLIVRGFGINGISGFSMIMFVLGLVALYSASGIYHGLDISIAVNKKLRKFDHSMIYVLIAGTYSPVCLMVLSSPKGKIIFTIVWGLAFAGILMAMLWIECPKWVSSLVYVLMGWTCIFAIGEIHASLTVAAFNWLFIGGIIYTVGGVIYALKLPIFAHMTKGFGNHELFHLFCIGGSICHYMMMLEILK